MYGKYMCLETYTDEDYGVNFLCGDVYNIRMDICTQRKMERI